MQLEGECLLFCYNFQCLVMKAIGLSSRQPIEKTISLLSLKPPRPSNCNVHKILQRIWLMLMTWILLYTLDIPPYNNSYTEPNLTRAEGQYTKDTKQSASKMSLRTQWLHAFIAFMSILPCDLIGIDSWLSIS